MGTPPPPGLTDEFAGSAAFNFFWQKNNFFLRLTYKLPARPLPRPFPRPSGQCTTRVPQCTNTTRGVNLYHLVKAQLFAERKMPLCGLVFTKPLQIKLFSDLHEEAFLVCVPSARRASLYQDQGAEKRSTPIRAVHLCGARTIR